MKLLWRMIERYYPWLLLLLGMDCFCAIILWISDIQAFQTLIELVVLTSIHLFSAILFVLNKRETTRRELFQDFLSNPTLCNEERLLSAISREEGESIRLLASVLQEHKTKNNSMADALQDYEEYVEGWEHEAKTPLSLLTMLLDNRSDEISPPLQVKQNYVRSQLQEDVTQMLYYAREIYSLIWNFSSVGTQADRISGDKFINITFYKIQAQFRFPVYYTIYYTNFTSKYSKIR